MRLNCLFYMTAEELINDEIKNHDISLCNKEHIKVLMIEFAKYHVEQALKEASVKATALNKAKFKGDINPQVDMDSILNTYSLSNIK